MPIEPGDEPCAPSRQLFEIDQRHNELRVSFSQDCQGGNGPQQTCSAISMCSQSSNQESTRLHVIITTAPYSSEAEWLSRIVGPTIAIANLKSVVSRKSLFDLRKCFSEWRATVRSEVEPVGHRGDGHGPDDRHLRIVAAVIGRRTPTPRRDRLGTPHSGPPRGDCCASTSPRCSGRTRSRTWRTSGDAGIRRFPRARRARLDVRPVWRGGARRPRCADSARCPRSGAGRVRAAEPADREVILGATDAVCRLRRRAGAGVAGGRRRPQPLGLVQAGLLEAAAVLVRGDRPGRAAASRRRWRWPPRRRGGPRRGGGSSTPTTSRPSSATRSAPSSSSTPGGRPAASARRPGNRSSRRCGSRCSTTPPPRRLS